MRVRNRYKGVAEGDLTPMIDMTFQLIAFFMVLINFTEAEQDQRVKLPESELAKPPETPMTDVFTVQLTKKSEAIFRAQTVELPSIKEMLIRERQLLELRDESASDYTIIVRAHERVPTGKVQELIGLCQDAGFEKFVLRAKEKQDY